MPGTVGVKHSTESDIRALKDIIGNYYFGFPIIKELLQNADDAGATRLDIGWIPANPELHNPLLKAPALIVTNDGPFSDKDADAIVRIGYSYKPDQDAAIGKFGRGLKSIFHLCEGFVFLQSTQVGLRQVRFGLAQSTLFTPWRGDEGLHREWYDYDTHDERLLVESIRPFLPETGTWFGLWVPLRRKAEGGLAPIEQRFDGDLDTPPAFITQELPDACRQTIQAFPMLRNLTCVQFWLPDVRGHMAPSLAIRLQEDSVRLHFHPSAAAAGRFHLRGSVAVTSALPVPAEGLFAGCEVLLPEQPTFGRLKEMPEWPAKDELGLERAKAWPHAAAVFSATPRRDSGELRVSDAVFLPVGDPPPLIPCPGPFDIALTLHGYYFVNSSRTAVEFSAGDSADAGRRLRAEWNLAVRREGSLASILTALDEFVVAASLDARSTEHLTQALSQNFRGELSALCVRHQWAKCLAPNGQSAYKLLDANEPLLELPAPIDDEQLPWQVFPALKNLAQSRRLTYEGVPSLSNHPVTSWSEDELLALLESIPAGDVFRDGAALAYLVTFLAANRDKVRGLTRLQDALICCVQDAIARVGLTALRESRPFLTILGSGDWLRGEGLLDDACVLTFDDAQLPATARRLVDEITAYLADAHSHVLVVPKSLTSVEGGPGSLHADDSRRLLCALAQPPKQLEQVLTFRQIRTRLACSIVTLSSEGAEAVVSEFANVPLFSAWVGSEGDDGTVSLDEIRRCSQSGRLLSRAGNASIEPAPATFAALGDAELLVVFDYVADALTYGRDARQCTPDSCAEIVLNATDLAPVGARIALVQKLLLSPSLRPVIKEAVRFLLHGEPTAARARDELLVGETGSGVWAKLARRALGGQQWRILDPAIAREIAPARWQELAVKPIDRRSVATLLWNVVPATIDCESLTDEDRAAVLEETDDIELLRSLRIHRHVDGTLQAIGDHTYEESDFELGAPLAATVNLVRRLNPPAREKLRLKTWSPIAAIGEALNSEKPQDLSAVILDALAAITEVPEAILVRLRTAAWLSLSDGRVVKPEDVIYIDGLEDHLAHVASRVRGAFFDIGQLQADVLAHPAAPLLKTEIFQSGDNALRILPDMIEDAGLADYAIGGIELDAGEIAMFTRAFSSAPPDIMPGCALVAAVSRCFGPRKCHEHLVKPLLKMPVSTARMIAILRYLSEMHRVVPSDDQKQLITLFERFLAGAFASGIARDVLADVLLLSRTGRWNTARALCVRYPNVDDRYVVSDRHAEILALTSSGLADINGVPDFARTASARAGIERSAELLQAYFRPWRGICPDAAIGAFLAFLGDGPGLEDLAQEYLGIRKVGFVRGQLNWIPLPAGVGGAGESVDDVLRQQQFDISIVGRGAPLEVMNLLGEPFTVQLRRELKSLVSNNLFRSSIGWGRTNRLDLIEVDPHDYSAAQLSRLLRDSTAAVLGQIYDQKGGGAEGLDQFWDDIEQSHLLHLRATQDCLLDHLLSSAKQLRLSPAPAIQDLIRLRENALSTEAEARHTTDPAKRAQWQASARRDIDAAREELRERLSDDPESQMTFLDSVRHHMHAVYQYQASSVPFELFQNADDAAVERAEMVGARGVESDGYEFVLSLDNGLLTFAHWGRSINDFRSAVGRDNQFRERGFHRDLEKMLMLGASDKSLPGEPSTVTGKFGLGFKSVFLLSEEPRVLSGRLAFRVLGGTYPREITGAEYEATERRLRALAPNVQGGTLIELPLRGRALSDAVSAVERFRSLAPILLAFARRTTRVVLRQTGREDEILTWASRPVPGTDGGCVGRLPGADVRKLPTSALVFDTAWGKLLLGLGARGVEPLPEPVPGLWFTAPTEEAIGLGFAVNGPFDLDVGRAQLARTSQANDELVERFGRGLGDVFVRFSDAVKSDWEATRQALGLSDDTTEYQFWESLLGVLASPFRPNRSLQDEHEGGSVILRLLWGDEERGAGKLFASRRALPSGLYGDYRDLVRGRDAKFIVRGLLAESRFLTPIAEYESFTSRVRPGAVVGESVVASLPLKEICPAELLDLETVLRWEFHASSYVAQTRVAAMLGSRLSDEDLDREHGSKARRDEAGLLRHLFEEIRFRARDNTVQSAHDLVVGHIDTGADEALRAAFAPENAVLSSEYDEDGVRFFRLCRERLSADTERLLEWGHAAGDARRREAFILYAKRGELRAQLHDAVTREPPSWLRSVEGDALVLSAAIDEREAERLRWNLGIERPRSAEPALPPEWLQPQQGPLISQEAAEAALLRIADWWRASRKERLRQYEQSVYPNGTPVLAGVDPRWLANRENKDVRRLWMKLLLLGATHRMGRAKPEQHREFLRLCGADGWLDIFARPHTESNGRDWIDKLKRQLDAQVDRQEYFHWLSLFVPVFQLSYRLNEYIELFLDADRYFGAGQPIQEFLSPAVATAYQGGGITAPPLRGALGIGAHFVLRELARAGVLTDEKTRTQCFVPRSRTCGLLQALGCPGMGLGERSAASSHIVGFLRQRLGPRWTLEGDFDIPLGVVAGDTSLQEEILGQEIEATLMEEDDDDV